MPESKLVKLLTNLQGFPYYYGGAGNFTQKSINYPAGPNEEPYVRFPLPEQASGVQADYYAANKASLDFPGRGSSLQTLANGIIIPRAAEYDTQRIQKFLKSSPKGYTFIAKQIGLQASNPKIEVGQQANLSAGDTTGRFFGMIENTRIYNGGINTLTAVKFAGSGVHVDRHGTVPYNPISTTYEKTVIKYNTVDESRGNRLVMLLSNKMLGVNNQIVNPSIPTSPANTNFFNNLDNLQRLGIPKSNENVLFQYPGGPGSMYGVGYTTIRRYENTDFSTAKNNSVHNSKVKGSTYSQIWNQASIVRTGSVTVTPAPMERPTDNSQTDTLTAPGNEYTPNRNARTFNYALLQKITDPIPASKYYDFRDTIAAQDSTSKTPTGSFSYSTYNMVKRIGISEVGTSPDTFKPDLLNRLNPGKDYPDEINHNKDLVKLRFEAIEYNYPGSEDKKIQSGIANVPIIFRAYITSFSDTHTGETTSYKYVGRGENFYTYTGFNRSVSFGFKIAAESRGDMEPLYKKLKYLLSQAYPDYTAGGYMRAPLVRVTVGEYLYRQPGFLTNMTVNIQNEYPWEVNIDGHSFEAPQILDVTCAFTPIHDFLPQRSKNANTTSETITKLIVPYYNSGLAKQGIQ